MIPVVDRKTRRRRAGGVSAKFGRAVSPVTAPCPASEAAPALAAGQQLSRGSTNPSGMFPAVSKSLLAVTAALALAMAFGVHGGPRLLLALGFVCFVPGWAALVGRGPAALADRLALSVAVGLSVSTLLTSALVFVGVWNPAAMFALVAIPSAALIGSDLRKEPGPQPDPRAQPGGRPFSIRRAWDRLVGSLRAPDALLGVAVVLWLVSLAGINPKGMNGYGLVGALPVAYLVALALLVASFVWEVSKPSPSPFRLAAQISALILLLHATVPMVFPEPRYAWVYKHFGVVNYINSHGSLNSGIDIYQNWPGFFALTAWFTKLAGASGPASFAGWAQVVFNLLFALQLGFVFRAANVPSRVRWIGIFLFVAGNWVAQDYFAPQAFAFVLALAIFGILLQRLGSPWTWAAAFEAAAGRRFGFRPGRDVHNADRAPVPHAPSLLLILLLFVAMGVSHQLSPFVVVISVSLLGLVGVTRPRWLVLVLVVPAVGYLALRFDYVTSHYNLLGPIGDLFDNTKKSSKNAGGQGEAGRLVVAQAAQTLSLAMWFLGGIGIVRRLRRGQPALVLGLLAFAPVLMLAAQDYGGEGIYRVYLFSLPWCALLAAGALVPEGPWSRWHVAGMGAVLIVLLGLFLPAYFGLEKVNEMRSGEVAASEYFYAHAPNGSVLILAAPNFPVRSGGRYDEFKVPWAVGDPNLMEARERAFRGRMLGAGDLDDIAEVMKVYESESGSAFLAISDSQKAFSKVYGLLPDGSLDSLDAALRKSPDWRLFLRNGDAAIYEFVAQG